MESIVETLRKLRLQGMKSALRRGKVTDKKFSNISFPLPGVVLALFFLAGAMLLFMFEYMRNSFKHGHEGFSAAIQHAAHFAWGKSLPIAILVVVGYYALVLLLELTLYLGKNKKLNRDFFEHMKTEHRFMVSLLIAWGIAYLINHLALAVRVLFLGELPMLWFSYTTYFSWAESLILIALLTCFVWLFLPYLLPPQSTLSKGSRFKSSKSTSASKKPFGLWLGKSTGKLAALSHRAAIAPETNVVLNVDEAAQNILVLGGIGAGKTTQAMQPLLAQLLDQDCGGVLFDIKGDVKSVVLKLGEMTKRSITLIGPEYENMNLLADLTPEMAASFLKSALLMGGGSKTDSFWIDTATQLCRNTLGLLSFLPQYYTLDGLHRYLSYESTREEVQEELTPLLVTLPEKEQRFLKNYLEYHDNVFATFDEKIKSGVKATISQVLEPFTHPDLSDAFSTYSASGFAMRDVLDGAIYVIDIPSGKWETSARIAYLFIKLRFFNVMQSRVQNPEWNQDRPIFFMCDEYQQLISANRDSLSDLSFWDKSRSSKTIGIISAQSVSSFYAAVGDHDLVDAILQNFRQKICFRTENATTLMMMDKIIGQVTITRQTRSKTSGSSSKGFTDTSSNHNSSTQTLAESRESVLDPALFRSLTANQAVALLSMEGQSMDDVLELLPVYL